MDFFRKLYQKISGSFSVHPLRTIILIALFVRIVAVLFSKGYGMHDDHFLVIEASQSWVDGTDYNNWLPQNRPGQVPDGHSFFYVGIHFLLFSFFKILGIADPEVKMYIVRALHALFSLLVVYFGYLIAQVYSNRKTALHAGLLLALFWFMPFLSVRNLVEIAAVPFLMAGVWLTVKSLKCNKKLIFFLYAGFIMGFAVSVRFQTVLFLGGAGLALLFMKKWKEAVLFGIGGLVNIAILQGITDLLIWKYPFAELKEYILYNLNNKFSYGNNNYFMYPSVILGFLIPPLSIFLIFGFFREWKRQLIIFLPVIVFFAFHEYFPNKQERFIFTVIPFFIVSGIVGWEDYVSRSSFWLKRQKLLRGFNIFFWSVNIFLLLFATTAYSKRSRVEAMSYFYDKNDSVNSIILDNNDKGGTLFIPMFYIGKFIESYQYAPSQVSGDSLALVGNSKHQHKFFSIEYFNQNQDLPEYILFYTDEELEKRINFYKQKFPDLAYETTVNPSFLDRLMYKLNPVNVNQVIYIYATKK